MPRRRRDAAGSKSWGGGAGCPAASAVFGLGRDAPAASAVFGLAPDAPAARARLGGGAARGDDAEHAHRLPPEAELLAAVGRRDVEPGQVLRALEPVAHGVTVRVQARRGPGDV